MATQHSLPSGHYSLLGPDFHRLDRASFAWRTHSITSSARASSVGGRSRPMRYFTLSQTSMLTLVLPSVWNGNGGVVRVIRSPFRSTVRTCFVQKYLKPTLRSLPASPRSNFADYRAADLGRHQVCGTRTAQNRSTASATALATVALRAGDESTCSSARLTIIPASKSTAGIRDSYSTARLSEAS